MSDQKGTGAPTLVRGCLSDLSEGAMQWLGRNLQFFDPLSPWSPLPVRRSIRAAIELALLCRVWAKLKPATDVLYEATVLLEKIWARPEFPLLIDMHGGTYADIHKLAYVALAPAGAREDVREAALARLKADCCRWRNHRTGSSKSDTSRIWRTPNTAWSRTGIWPGRACSPGFPPRPWARTTRTC